MIPARDARATRTGSGARSLLVGLALIVAACGTPVTRTPAPSPGSPTPAPSGEPLPTGESTPGPSEEPLPTGGPTEPPGSPAPSATTAASVPPGSAASCSGNDDNRAFFAAVAQAVAWDVYCAVLPAGWFVDAGEFRLAGGGKMTIAYKGPGGQRIEIREGAYCAGVDGCIPSGPGAGSASFGDRPARLLDAGGGAWLVVAEGGDVNWEAKGAAMDATSLSAFTASFARVGD